MGERTVALRARVTPAVLGGQCRVPCQERRDTVVVEAPTQSCARRSASGGRRPSTSSSSYSRVMSKAVARSLTRQRLAIAQAAPAASMIEPTDSASSGGPPISVVALWHAGDDCEPDAASVERGEVAGRGRARRRGRRPRPRRRRTPPAVTREMEMGGGCGVGVEIAGPPVARARP